MKRSFFVGSGEGRRERPAERAHFFSATREGLNRGRRKHGLRGFLSEESTLALESGGMAAALVRLRAHTS
jgi:hypothetical protein